jgi:hypothetical protein
VPRLLAVIGFFCSEVIVLIIFLALGILLFAAVPISGATSSSSVLATREVLRAIGVSVLFIVVSGYLASVAMLLVIFRNRLLSLTHATWLTALFALHAVFFIFYLRGPAIVSSSMLLVAVGVICVSAAAATQYVLWRRWL